MSRLRAVCLSTVLGLTAASALAEKPQQFHELVSSGDALDFEVEVYDDRLLQDYVERVGRGLVAALGTDVLDRELRFLLVVEPEPGVRSLGDGRLLLHSGLLAALENEAQLAAVLAPELARACVEPSGGSEGVDRFGLGLLIAAGYDPVEALRAWELLDDDYTEPRSSSRPWIDGSPEERRAWIDAIGIGTPHLEGPSSGGWRRNEGEYSQRVGRLRRDSAILDYEAGEHARAERTLVRILAHDAGDAVAHLYLGKILWDTAGVSRADEVLGELRLAAELAPTLAEPHREMGLVYEGLGYRESAAAAFERYLELSPSADDGPELLGHLDPPK